VQGSAVRGEQLYDAWDGSYWSAHETVLRAVAAAPSVLDVGCATGNLAVRIKESGATVVGVEPNPRAASLAQSRGIEVVVAPFDRSAVGALAGRTFSVVVFADTLEHMLDPLDALVLARSLLAGDGRVVASLPNVGVWHARALLALGHFDYRDGGIFDRTHIRFFTLSGARRLALAAGYRVERIWTTRVPLPVGPRWLRTAWDEAYGRVAPLAPRLLAEQFVMVLGPLEGDGPPGSWP
jgi:SAM-dependent methyltransferase